MEQQLSHERVDILHELDLGQHTLFIMSDGSIDLLANDEQTPYLADNGIRLDSDETYRLFISLQEQFKDSGKGEESTLQPQQAWGNFSAHLHFEGRCGNL